MKTNFDKIITEISNFEKKANFDKTTRKQLIRWVKEEINVYENSKNKKIRSNKLIDIIILTTQLAKRDKTSLDKEWKKWWIKSNRYTKPKKAVE